MFAYTPSFSVADRRQRSFYMDKRHFDDIVEGLRMAGIDPHVAP